MRGLFKWLKKNNKVAGLATLPCLADIPNLAGKKVLLRAGLNAPVEDCEVVETFRIEAAIPTIEYLKQKGAKVIIIGHIGRDTDDSLEPVARVLEKMAGVKWGGQFRDGSNSTLENLQNGEAVLLENLRQDPRESTNDEEFTKELAALADVYVNDAFSDSHREHASIVGVPEYLPSYFGLSFIKEYQALEKVFEPKHPALFVIGGAKFDTKMPLVLRYAELYDAVFVGGALANDIFKAKGFEVGKSLVSDIDVKKSTLLDYSNIIIPSDVVTDGQNDRREVGARGVSSSETILDVGPDSLKDLAPLVKEAKTIVWNGPLGNYEKGFTVGTETLALMIATSSAYSVVGGGDTIASIRSLGLSDQFGFLSTAGGAMLIFLETGTLPAIEAVMKR